MLELALDLLPTPTGASSIYRDIREDETLWRAYVDAPRARIMLAGYLEAATASGHIDSQKISLKLPPPIRYLDKDEQAIFNGALLDQVRIIRRLKK